MSGNDASLGGAGPRTDTIADHYRRRAAHERALAAAMPDPALRAAHLRAAASCETLADRHSPRPVTRRRSLWSFARQT